ncbi:MAG TPA: RsmB/NOP family class I SAM-dependent RNA methyltransferase [Sphingobacteriaceae bacterium]|nr:RsmB/NOP family class I SAM-dependent RNA methyltransferase [Sphingobacteriaceae bacterium]
MERYRWIIPDWEAFSEALDRPQPVVLRANPLRIEPAALAAHLAGLGFRLRPLAWAPGFFQVESGPFPVAKTVAHWLGLFYIQEAAAAVPALAVGARPGERILDLCAAPGGKTTLLAAQVGPQGVVVANEPDGSRVRALLSNLARLGVFNVVVTRYDGRDFPGHRRFHRVLADVPCSAEGNARRSPRVRGGTTPRQARRLARLQGELLARAADLVAPGGVLVYSTCTFAPEENEAVVDGLLRSRADSLPPAESGEAVPGRGQDPFRIEPLAVPVPASAPGLTAWEDQTFHPDLALTTRLYPHHLDSGGMYVARLVRAGDPGAVDDAGLEAAHLDPGADGEAAATYLQDRFDLPQDVFAGLGVYRVGRDLWLSTVSEVPPYEKVAGIGLAWATPGSGGFKPLAPAMVHYGSLARRNRVDLTVAALVDLLEGRRVKAGGWDLTPGPVILTLGGHVIGPGQYDQRGLRAALAPERAAELRECLRLQDQLGMGEEALPPRPGQSSGSLP